MATNVPRTLPRRAASARPAWRGRGAERAIGCRDRHAPSQAELSRERRRRMLAALERSVRIRRHGQSVVGIRARERVHDELSGDEREAPQPTFLPASNERASRVVVHDRRPRRRERQPPSRSTRRSDEQATPSAPRSARRAAAGSGAARLGTSPQSCAPGRRQTTHRRGKSRSSTPHHRRARTATRSASAL